MRFTGLEDIDPGVRSIILVTVAMAYPAWSFGFDLGAFGRLFFDKIFVAWSISTALFFVLLFIPKSKLRVPKLAWYATLIPSLWLVLALMVRATPDVKLLGYALTASGLVAYIACFPYVIYMSVSVAYPDLLKLKKPGPWILIGSIVVGLVAVGYVSGSNHFRFLTCDDFDLSGKFVPHNCSPGPGRE